MASFGEKLKQKRICLGLSQKNLGELIGLKQSTIANYENGVRFPKVDNLKKIVFHLKISIDGILENNDLSPMKEITDKIFDESQSKFMRALIDMDEDKALLIIKNFENNWASIFVIYEVIIKKSLYDIGILWSLGRLSVIQEHFATQVCDKAISMLSYNFNFIEKLDITAICMTVNPEEHSIGIKIISEALRSVGIKSYYIGTKIPTDQLILALISHRVRFLALSVSLLSHIDGMANLIKIIKSDPRINDLIIVVGGRAFENNSSLALENGADLYAKDSYDLIEKIEQFYL